MRFWFFSKASSVLRGGPALKANTSGSICASKQNVNFDPFSSPVWNPGDFGTSVLRGLVPGAVTGPGYLGGPLWIRTKVPSSTHSYVTFYASMEGAL